MPYPSSDTRCCASVQLATIPIAFHVQLTGRTTWFPNSILFTIKYG